MKIKERAAYAWTRIVDLFKPKKPEIEVEIEEMDDETVKEKQDSVSTLSPEEVPAHDLEDAPESTTPERMGEEEAVPSRMTEEYKAWMEEQFATEEDTSPDDL